jgi:hypothetical protein
VLTNRFPNRRIINANHSNNEVKASMTSQNKCINMLLSRIGAVYTGLNTNGISLNRIEK